MRPSYGALLKRFLLLAIVLCLLILVCPRHVGAGPRPFLPPAQAAPPKLEKPSLEEEETQALTNAVRSAQGNPQVLIQNLEDFLARFPKTSRREQVLRTIYQQAMETNVPAKAISAGEKLLETNPDDLSLLSTLVDLLGREAGAHSQAKALDYAHRLVARAEKEAPPPAGFSEEKWKQSQPLMRASVYLARAKIYIRTGKTALALADLRKSYAAYATARVAERLGDLLASSGQPGPALDYYVTAFAFPEKEADMARREQLRRKLSTLYLAQHSSEAGLGDLILKRYDELSKTLSSRWKLQGESNSSTEGRDPFDFVLMRLDGSAMKLADYRGKVLVMEFWATWCGPCRLEGKLLERTWEKFRQDSGAVFLGVSVDDDHDAVPPFVEAEHWTFPVAYAQGIDRLLRVRAIPTLIIFDRTGRVVFRQEGVDVGSFVETIEKRVREAEALQPASAPAGSR